MTFENIPLSDCDMKLIQLKPKVRAYFEGCVSELNKMATKKFWASMSFYSILKMSGNLKKLSNLTKNKKLVSQFNKKIRQFFYYKEDLLNIWNKAVEIKNISLEVEFRLKSVLDHYFPEIVIRNLAKNLNIEDLPLL